MLRIAYDTKDPKKIESGLDKLTQPYDRGIKELTEMSDNGCHEVYFSL